MHEKVKNAPLSCFIHLNNSVVAGGYHLHMSHVYVEHLTSTMVELD